MLSTNALSRNVSRQAVVAVVVAAGGVFLQVNPGLLVDGLQDGATRTEQRENHVQCEPVVALVHHHHRHVVEDGGADKALVDDDVLDNLHGVELLVVAHAHGLAVQVDQTQQQPHDRVLEEMRLYLDAEIGHNEQALLALVVQVPQHLIHNQHGNAPVHRHHHQLHQSVVVQDVRVRYTRVR